MGESALVGAAVANPVAGQLQRVFGVSQLKIDPTFVSGSELPQARLTLQQQAWMQGWAAWNRERAAALPMAKISLSSLEAT